MYINLSLYTVCMNGTATPTGTVWMRSTAPEIVVPTMDTFDPDRSKHT